MKLLIVPKWVLPFGYGLTLYKLALVRKEGYDMNYTAAHEECHTIQWAAIGFFRFPYRYLVELYKVGYWNNKYEVEARAYGKKMCKIKKYV
tara:strand:- start:798 stop:1070 length:273 start_codon:yes stop_codon:yes gene_type:complete